MFPVMLPPRLQGQPLRRGNTAIPGPPSQADAALIQSEAPGRSMAALARLPSRLLPSIHQSKTWVTSYRFMAQGRNPWGFRAAGARTAFLPADV